MPAKNAHLLIIDPQNDFCDIPEDLLPTTAGVREQPALPVPGAHQDMLNLAEFINTAGDKLAGITATLDSHAAIAIERTTFWVTRDGAPVEPYTEISLDSVRAGDFSPRNPLLLAMVLHVLKQLEEAGRYKLRAWPPHCIVGGWGHGIHAAVLAALNNYERQTFNVVRKALKGEYPLSEHYGVFQAETPQPNVLSTQFNYELALHVTDGVDYLFGAGEALSHCFRASFEQLWSFLNGPSTQKKPQIVLLTDCTSPVRDFEQDGADFLAQMREKGVLTMTSVEALDLLGA